MDIQREPIARRIEWLFDLARRHGEAFAGPDAALARARHLARHPTAVVVLKCMDGRMNIALATRTPIGILRPVRNLGGMFDLGWPYLGEVLAREVQDAVRAGRRVLILVTYHFSRGDPHRGCAGFRHDTEAAKAHVQGLRDQILHVFGAGRATVYPLVCGFETDEEALILHGDGADTLDLAALGPDGRGVLDQRLASLLPDLPAPMRADLLPLLEGNLDHIDSVRIEARRRPRALDIEHREWAICLGQGFDFLHTPNTALIIGPYSPDLAEPIRRAAGIVQANMAAGRIPDDGVLLLASAPYDDLGVDRARAELKSRFLSRLGATVIAAAHPELAARMTVRTAVLEWRSRTLQVLEAG